MRGIAKSAAFAAIALMLCTCPARADVIRLKNGTSLTGEIAHAEGALISVRTVHGTKIIQKSDLEGAEAPRGYQRAPSTSRREPSVFMAFFKKASLVICILLFIVAWLWVILLAFSESPLWGIAVILFHPFGALCLTVAHWERARIPFVMHLIGCLFLAVALL